MILTFRHKGLHVFFETGSKAGIQAHHAEGNTMLMHNPAHPGAVLAEWLEGVTIKESAERLAASRQTLSAIIHQRANITADMDLRLADALGTTPGFWAGLQTDFDIWTASQQTRPHIERVPHLGQKAA